MTIEDIGIKKMTVDKKESVVTNMTNDKVATIKWLFTWNKMLVITFFFSLLFNPYVSYPLTAIWSLFLIAFLLRAVIKHNAEESKKKQSIQEEENIIEEKWFLECPQCHERYNYTDEEFADEELGFCINCWVKCFKVKKYWDKYVGHWATLDELRKSEFEFNNTNVIAQNQINMENANQRRHIWR